MCYGFIKLDRSITEHPDYFAEPFTRMSAWVDMLFLAAWKDGTRYVHKVKVEYRRGQAIVSLRFLEERWRRNQRTIMKFLQEWEEDGRVTLAKHGKTATLVTITNYDKYQFSTAPNAAPSAAPQNADPARDSGLSDSGGETPNAPNSAAPSAANRKKVKNNISLPPNGVRERASAPPARKDTETKAKKFIPPTEEQVTAYCAEKGYTIDPVHFFSYYTSNGWRVGRSPMKDWKAAAKTWQQKENKQQQNATTSTSRRADEEDAAKQHRYAIYEATLQRLLGS